LDRLNRFHSFGGEDGRDFTVIYYTICSLDFIFQGVKFASEIWEWACDLRLEIEVEMSVARVCGVDVRDGAVGRRVRGGFDGVVWKVEVGCLEFI
jgi:hypothetical protein